MPRVPQGMIPASWLYSSYSLLSIEELQNRLLHRPLEMTGPKATLIARLREDDADMVIRLIGPDAAMPPTAPLSVNQQLSPSGPNTPVNPNTPMSQIVHGQLVIPETWLNSSYSRLTVAELQDRIRQRDLAPTDDKVDMVGRLCNHDDAIHPSLQLFFLRPLSREEYSELFHITCLRAICARNGLCLIGSREELATRLAGRVGLKFKVPPELMAASVETNRRLEED